MQPSQAYVIIYGIMMEELIIREINKAAGRCDSDSQMTSFEVIMPLKLQSTKILINSIWDMISLLHYSISMHNMSYCKKHCMVSAGNSWLRVETKKKWRVGV